MAIIFKTLFIVVFITKMAYGQIGTESIKQYPDKMQVSLINSYQDFKFSAGVANNSIISYRNSSIKTGLRIRVGKVGLAFAIPVVYFHPSKSALTKNFALLFNIYPSGINVRGSFRKVKGFEQENGTTTIYRPDVNLTHFETSGTYVFNKNFSLRAPFRYFERQVNNSGSLLALGTADYKTIHASDSLFFFPQEIASPIQSINILSFGLGTGYGYTLTKGNWYITGLFTGGAELKHWRYYNNSEINFLSGWKLRPVIITHLSMGYNADRYFMGLVSFYRPDFGAVNDLDASFYRFRAALIVGYRFDTPSFMKKKK